MIRTFLVEAFRIPTGSMENTLLVGDFLLVNKAISGSRVPFTRLRLPAFDSSRRGDVAFVQRDAMRRKHLFVHYSFEPGSHTPPSWLTGTRWRRTGERVHGPAET